MSATLFVLLVFWPASGSFHTAGAFKSKAECEQVGQIYDRHYCAEVYVAKPKEWR